jgi:hypothetical protein
VIRLDDKSKRKSLPKAAEIVNLDIEVNSKAELKALLIEDYGEQLAEQIWASWGTSSKLIETDYQEKDCTPDSNNHTPDSMNQPQNSLKGFDTASERGPNRNLDGLALESISNSAAPKLK